MLRRSCNQRGSAFTLVEVLVSIGVIGVLIALVVPALHAARGQAQQAVTRANLRQTHMAFSAYTAHYGETYPWRPLGGDWILLHPQGRIQVRPGHFEISHYWPGMMMKILPWEEHYRSWLGGGAGYGDAPWLSAPGVSNAWRQSSFALSQSFLARPRLWTPGATDTSENLRPVRESDVLAPASKVLLHDVEKAHLRNDPDADRDVTLMVFVDGHVASHRLSEARVLTDRPWREPWPLNDTPNGVRGRDY